MGCAPLVFPSVTREKNSIHTRYTRELLQCNAAAAAFRGPFSPKTIDQASAALPHSTSRRRTEEEAEEQSKERNSRSHSTVHHRAAAAAPPL